MGKKATKRSSADAKWQTKWPRNGDRMAWLRAMVEKCDAIVATDVAAQKAHLPIERLAELGETAESLRLVNRYLKRLTGGDVVPWVHMAQLGAEICLDANDLDGMERFLAIAEATEKFNTRKCDKGFSLQFVREFRTYHGLLDPAEAVDDAERVEATFRRAARQFQLAHAGGKRKAAQAAATEMEQSVGKIADKWERRRCMREVVEAYAKVKDADGVRKCIRRLDKEDREDVLDARTLAKLGLKEETVAQAKAKIAERLDALRVSSEPNIHFDAMEICGLLKLLVELGEKDTARRLLKRALKEMPKWPVIELGWTTSAVYSEFADAAAVVEGRDAAKKLLELAKGDAGEEQRSGFRRGAIATTVPLTAKIDSQAAAIEQARKIRSPASRRAELGALLAQAGRWKELQEVLGQVATPEEAADVAWKIQFKLADGVERGSQG
jgi:tetratricopeptide (TPR) repeat protein